MSTFDDVHLEIFLDPRFCTPILSKFFYENETINVKKYNTYKSSSNTSIQDFGIQVKN